MKSKNLVLILLVLCLAIAWSSKVKIDWQWNNKPIVELPESWDGQKFELGLREDGVVCWRVVSKKINSPAEDDNSTLYHWSNTTSGTTTNIINIK